MNTCSYVHKLQSNRFFLFFYYLCERILVPPTVTAVTVKTGDHGLAESYKNSVAMSFIKCEANQLGSSV